MLLGSLKLNTLHDLFVAELKDMYDAEHQIIEAMPKMIDAASSQELKDDFKKHSEQTRWQISQLEEVFDMLDIDPERQHCDGMAGILKDGEKMVKAEGESHVKDAALIAAAQKVEHYEIASYGTLRTFANTMGHPDVAEKLQGILEQEKGTDKLLTSVAESGPNPEAPKM